MSPYPDKILLSFRHFMVLLSLRLVYDTLTFLPFTQLKKQYLLQLVKLYC